MSYDTELIEKNKAKVRVQKIKFNTRNAKKRKKKQLFLTWSLTKGDSHPYGNYLMRIEPFLSLRTISLQS